MTVGGSKLLLLTFYFFLTIRFCNIPEYGVESGLLIFEFSKYQTSKISDSGVRLFQFNIR